MVGNDKILVSFIYFILLRQWTFLVFIALLVKFLLLILKILLSCIDTLSLFLGGRICY